MCVGAALLVVVSGVGSDEASQGVWLAALLAAAVTGFLFWNFPPARIFMGMLVAVSWGYHWWPFPASRMGLAAALLGLAHPAGGIHC